MSAPDPSLITDPAAIAAAEFLASFVYTGGFPNIPDSSVPGPLAQTQEIVGWVYDIDPATGVMRATFTGEVSYTSGPGGVSSFNTRTGAVTLQAADVTGVGGALSANVLPLTGGTLTGPLTPAGLVGVSNGSNAAAGQIGEFLSNLNSGGTSMPGGTTINIAQITLTAGDWDVFGLIAVGAGTGGVVQGGINTVSATLPAGMSLGAAQVANVAAGNMNMSVGPVHQNVTTNTTMFLVAVQSGSTAGTGFGWIAARRMH